MIAMNPPSSGAYADVQPASTPTQRLDAPRKLEVLTLTQLVDGATRVTALRPTNRAACKNGPRPCPWVSCRFHLWTEVAFVKRRHRYRFRGDDAPDPMSMSRSCSLDVADEGEHTLEEVGEILGLTRERVRQIEAKALARLSKQFSATEREAIVEWFGE